jgi:hypothetical protein
MIRFYKYVIYRLYSWRLEKNDDTPIATIVFTMCFIHFLQLMIVMSILAEFFPVLVVVFNQKEVFVFILFFLFSMLYYLFIYDKKRWQGYIEEFKDETPEQRRKGTLFVQWFTIGSIILFFAVLVIIITISEYKKLPGV